MSEETMQQAKAIIAAADELDERSREVAIAYMQGMSAATKILQPEQKQSA